jgi:hypothetical protein
MSEDPSLQPVRITGEERSRPAFRLLARAAIELARLGITKRKETPNEGATASAENEEGHHA